MKRIPLTQGQYAIVDDWNYERLSKYGWISHWRNSTRSFYVVRASSRLDDVSGKQNTIYMHREILGLKKGDKRQVDHINHDTLDNREGNLRIITDQKNKWNRRNSKGYSWHKGHKKYIATITVNRKNVHLGYFDTPEEAHQAYLKAKQEYHKF